MRRLLLSFLVIFGLFSAMGQSALALSHDDSHRHVLEMSDSGVADNAADSETGGPLDTPGTPGHHHHGMSDVVMAMPRLATTLFVLTNAPLPSSDELLISLRQAPPTEPPAA